MRGLFKLLKAQATALHWATGRGTPAGIYIPYRYAPELAPAKEDDAIGWLCDAFDALVPEFHALADYAARFDARHRALAGLHGADCPRYDQDWFPGLDAIIAYALVRKYAPRRIVEIGSGHSTRVMHQALADAQTGGGIHSIDPMPRRDIERLCSHITRATISSAPARVWEELESGDILFLDGSHVCMPGTDVDFVFSHVLPGLRPGVLVHVHDIFLPTGYPDAWRWRAYNEQALVAALLAGGGRFRVVMANAFVRRHHPGVVDGLFAPLIAGARESSLWLEVQPGSPVRAAAGS